MLETTPLVDDVVPIELGSGDGGDVHDAAIAFAVVSVFDRVDCVAVPEHHIAWEDMRDACHCLVQLEMRMRFRGKLDVVSQTAAREFARCGVQPPVGFCQVVFSAATGGFRLDTCEKRS